MHKSLVSILLLLAVKNAHSQQQYIVKYDLTNSKSQYYKVGKDTTPVRSLDLKKSGRITLKVDNFNPFYWDAKVTSYKAPVQEESGYANAFNPFSILTSGLTDIFSGIPTLDLPKSKGNGTDANSRFLNSAAAYAENFQRVQVLSEKFDQLQLIEVQLKELKYNITKTEAQIKNEAQQMVREALGTDSLSLLNILSIGKQYNKDLSNSLDALKSLNSEVQQSLSAVNAESRIEGKSFDEIAQTTARSYTALSKISSLQQKNPNLMLDEVAEVGNLYREIANANFHFIYGINTEPDLSYLKLEVFPKTGASAKDTMVQYFQLRGKRSLKIKNSVGAAFTYFTANNTSYFINSDSVISRSDKDLFNPLIATLIHFYSGRTAGFKWGGAFGIGIPLTGEKKDINFLLGLSTAFGQNDPVLLTVGFSGAKVNKLTSGYTLGSKTTQTNPDKLVTQGYDIGGFVSVTFNLSSLARK